MSEDFIPFHFDEDAVEYFTRGYCGNLAVELNKRYGYTIYSLFFGDIEGNIPCHYIVGLSNGRFVDIYGIWVLRDIIEFWRNHKDNEDGVQISIKPSGDNLDNDDYMDNMKLYSPRYQKYTSKTATLIHQKIYKNLMNL